MAGVEAVGVGLIGFGTIGTGVATVLQRNASVISQRLGFPLRLVRIADLETDRDRGVDLEGIRFDADVDGLIDDPAVSIVIELVGGYDVAKRLTQLPARSPWRSPRCRVSRPTTRCLRLSSDMGSPTWTNGEQLRIGSCERSLRTA